MCERDQKHSFVIWSEGLCYLRAHREVHTFGLQRRCRKGPEAYAFKHAFLRESHLFQVPAAAERDCADFRDARGHKNLFERGPAERPVLDAFEPFV